MFRLGITIFSFKFNLKNKYKILEKFLENPEKQQSILQQSSSDVDHLNSINNIFNHIDQMNSSQ